MPLTPEVKKQIQDTLDQNTVVVFMKGSKSFPQCGFSATVVEVMKRLGAEFKDVNVLSDPGVREGIKEFSSWPTIPQVYVKGKFVGGCDIIKDMYESGELEPIVREAGAVK